MNDPYLHIPKIFDEARQNQLGCARVAVVGPRLSGKTELLNSMSAELRGRASAILLQVRLDLAVERFKEFDDPALQLAAALRQNLKSALPKNQRVDLPKLAPLSSVIEKLLLALPDRHILLEIDHLEAAPLYMARALAEQLHPLLDMGVSSDSEAAQRLGVLVCGSISLHSLLDVRNSGFIHCTPISALTGDPDVRRAAVERQLRTQEWTNWGQDAAAALAEWTGGEPAFVLPVLRALDGKKKLTRPAVENAALKVSDLNARQPVLSDLAMEVHRNPTLQSLVVSALFGEGAPVAPDLRAATEISEPELAGVFIAHQRRYEFRNAIVREFMMKLMTESQRLNPWISRVGSGSRLAWTTTGDALQLPLRVESMAREIAADTSIWAILPRLAELWKALLPAYLDPEVTVLANIEARWYRFDTGAHKVVLLDGQSPVDLMPRMAEGTKRAAERAKLIPAGAAHAAFFDGDNGRLAVGVPVGSPQRVVAIVTTIRRQQREGAAWSEPSLRNWIWFLRQDAGSNLSVRVEREILQHLREESRGDPALKQAFSGLIDDIQRFRVEMIVHSRLERLSTRLRNWGNAILTQPFTDTLTLQLTNNIGNYRDGWEEIRKNEFAELQTTVADEFSSAPNEALAKAVDAIAASATIITEAIQRPGIDGWTTAAKSLCEQLKQAIDISRGTPGKLQKVVAKAHGALGNRSERPAPAPRPMPPDAARDFDVFLSHNSSDKETVRLLHRQLKDRGLKPWLDETELPPGQQWQDGLEEIIQTCAAAAVCISSSGFGCWEEPEVKALLRRSVEEKKAGKNFPIIPVLLPAAPADADLPVFLGAYTWVDLRQGLTPKGIQSLIWGITGENPHR